MHLTFEAEVIYWRGPAPWYFFDVPEAPSRELKAIAPHVTYGWGMIPAVAHASGLTWSTALFPKDGRYLLPIKAAERRAMSLEVGDRLVVDMEVGT